MSRPRTDSDRRRALRLTQLVGQRNHVAHQLDLTRCELAGAVRAPNPADRDEVGAQELAAQVRKIIAEFNRLSDEIIVLVRERNHGSANPV